VAILKCERRETRTEVNCNVDIMTTVEDSNVFYLRLKIYGSCSITFVNQRSYESINIYHNVTSGFAYTATEEELMLCPHK
jgi:hypothetical protein